MPRATSTKQRARVPGRGAETMPPRRIRPKTMEAARSHETPPPKERPDGRGGLGVLRGSLGALHDPKDPHRPDRDLRRHLARDIAEGEGGRSVRLDRYDRPALVTAGPHAGVDRDLAEERDREVLGHLPTSPVAEDVGLLVAVLAEE